MEQPDQVLLREARLSDKPVLLEFEQGVIEAERPMDPTIRAGEVHYYDLEALIEDPDTCFLLAEFGGRAVACGYARPKAARPYLDHAQYAYLGFMFTLPEFRGRGINKRILDKLAEWAAARGLWELRLTVYVSNQPAIKAYEKAGFGKHLLEMRRRIQ